MGTTVNTGIYGGLQPTAPQANPLGLVGEFAGAKNALNQVLLFKAQQAAGRDVQGTVNPLTGEYDPAAATRAIAADPTAAVAAPEAIQQAQATGVTGLQATGLELNQRILRLNAASNGLGALLLQNPSGIPRQAFTQAIDQFSEAGLLPPHERDAVTGMVSDDPKANSALAQRLIAASQQSLREISPAYQGYGTGSGTVIGNVNAAAPGGTTLPAGSLINHGLSPEALAQPITYKGPNGQPITEPLGTYLGKAGIPVAPQVTTPGGPTVALPQVNVGQGYINPPPAAPAAGAPAAPAAPATGTSPTAAAPPVVGPGGTVAGPLPGTVESQTAESQAGAKAVVDASNTLKSATQANASLALLKQFSAGFSGGTLSPAMMDMVSGLQSLGIHVDTKELTDYQVFNKVMHQLASSALASGALDQATDMRLQHVINSLPNIAMNKGARDEAITTVQGAVAAENAYAKGLVEFSQNRPGGVAPAQLLPEYAKTWNQKYPNTVVFQWPYMNKAQRLSLLDSMPPSAQKQLVMELNTAVNDGIMNRNIVFNAPE